MVNIIKRRNSTTLDDKALKYSLVRGRDESLDDFHKRLIKCMSNMESSRFKFEKSLEYALPTQGFEVFKITSNATDELLEFKITDTRIEIIREGEIEYKKKLQDIKFLKNLKADLDTFSFLTVTVITTEGWEYLRAENLTQCVSVRTRLEYTANGAVNILPEKNILNAQDFLGNFEEDVGDGDIINSLREYALEDNNILHKNSEIPEKIFFEYLDFPLFLSWSPIRSYKINGKDFNDVLNTRVKNDEAFGIIDENTTVENNETVELLSQKGAKIINKILTKHNTYWGE